MTRFCIAAAACLTAAVLPVRAAATNWFELQTTNFTIWAEANDGATRTLAWQLEQMRHVAKTLWPWMKVDLSKPLVVLAVKDEAAMRRIAPQYWEVKNGIRPASVWVTAPDRHYMAIRTDIRTRDDVMVTPHINAYFSYGNLVLASSFGARPPTWLLRGLAGVLSNTLVRQDDVVVGAAIPWHLETLRGRRQPLRRILSDTGNPTGLRTAEEQRYFDAQSWAFVHFLMFADQGIHAPKLNAFVGLIDSGQAADAAFASAIGDVAEYERAFDNYVNRSLFTAARLRVDVNVDRDRFPARQMVAAETAAAKASFHVSLRRTVEARALIEEAVKADPASPMAVAAEAIMLDMGGNPEAARAAYDKAVVLGTTNAYVLYRAAILSRRGADSASLAQAEASLAKAVEINPLFTMAQASLAEVRAELGRSRLSIVGPMQRAVALEPSNPWPRIVAARVLRRLGATDEARKAAESALKLADDDAAARAEAERLVALFKQEPEPQH